MNLSLPRASGVQLHPTSLPSGRLGREAFAFVDWLAEAGQSYWQMLPLGPPDRYGSPYKAKSAFAAWSGLLAEPTAAVSREEMGAFRARESFWVDDWARFGPGRPGELIADQVRFDREWAALRRYAADRGVRLIGDVPIYVAPGSADQRAHPGLFRDDAVAGVPPDAFTDKGQLWGNPLYDWPALRRHGHYAWWTERFRRVFELYDLARIDHFRGFVAYWAVPRGARDARGGTWKRGPGRAVFDAAGAALGGSLPLIAEDLGVITPAVERLRDDLGYPGMVVLQFGFDGDPRSPHLPDNHVEARVVYTGTHDHDTIRGWWDGLDLETRERVDRSIDAHGVRDAEPHWSLIRLAFASPARLAMVQAQDVLGLGSEARMNMPGTAKGAWRWRLRDGALTSDLAKRLREATEAAERTAG
jgi:4-alpha-glucanotransferase